MRQALRGLTRRPGFAAVAVVTLALGLGASAAIFSVIDAALLRPLPFPQADRLVTPWEYSAEFQQRLGLDRLPSSPANVLDFRARNRTLSGLASMRADRATISRGGDPERVAAVKVSVEFFDVLGIPPIAGRAFVGSDLAGGQAVVIGEALWRRRLAASPDLHGQQLSVNGVPTTVVGVMPAGFRFPSAGELPEAFGFSSRPELWTLDVLTPEQQVTRGGKSFAMVAHQMWAVIRTAGDPAALASAARAAVLAVDPDQPVSRVVTMPDVVAASISDRRFSMTLVGLFAGLALVLSIVGIYAVVSYSVAERLHEMGLRLALGARPSNLLAMVLGEGFRLVTAGLALGIAGALAVTRFLDALLFGVHARDAATFAGVAVVLSMAALLGCLVPALRAMRVDPMMALRAE